ncbi:MAG: ABC transporter ATP-binding protein [Fervidobacterium sp.]
MLELINIEKRFSKDKKDAIALQKINAKFSNSDVVAIIGENGSGKSTLLKLIATILKPTSGKITYNQKDIFENRKLYRNLISFISEDSSFLPELSVKDNLEYFSKMFSSSIKVENVASRVKIENLLNFKPKDLSKGQRQRLSIAINLLKNPEIVLLDEPAEGLDFETKEIVKEIIKEYKDNNKIILYVTHDEDEIEQVCDKILILNAGRAIFYGTVEEFWNKYEKFYNVVYIENFQKKSCIVSLEKLNQIKGHLKILHVRNLRLREIINLSNSFKIITEC